MALSLSAPSVILASTSVNLELPATGGAFSVPVSKLSRVLDAYNRTELLLSHLAANGTVRSDCLPFVARICLRSLP